MTVGGGKEYQFYGGEKNVENESILMQILDKVKAQTNNPAQQPAPPHQQKSVKREGKNLFIRFQHHPLEIPSVNGFIYRKAFYSGCSNRG